MDTIEIISDRLRHAESTLRAIAAGPFKPTDFRLLRDAADDLVKARNEVATLRGGQCRAEHAYDEGIGAPGRSRCELDAGHSGAHEDGDWGWSE